MDFKKFIDNNNNKFIDFDGKYGDQCVDLARAYIKQVLNLKQPAGVVGAKNFFENYEKDNNLKYQFTRIVNTPWFVPKSGDIMIWNGKYGPYGHIAIVVDANVMSFRAFSQNDPANSPCVIKKYSYKNVYGVLRAK